LQAEGLRIGAYENWIKKKGRRKQKLLVIKAHNTST
jgi:hypothetical protein